MAELTELHEQIIRGGVVFGATVNDRGHPDITRVFGVKVHDDRRTLRVLIGEAWLHPAAENLRVGAWFALSFTFPPSYQSFQAKGRILRIEDVTDEDRAAALVHRDEFARVCMTVGINETALRYAHRPAVAVLFEIENLYCQTPGPGAGDPVGGAR
ncbi:MAG TPA: hypothetical protein VL326_07410 [Kofleriaceae bacterium]|nr:hypothetical protein [Kofleriaceae bacterium]